MSSEFKKGQLVAVRDGEDESWALVKYDHKVDRRHVVKRIAGSFLVASEDKYKICLPAEEVWPDIFLDKEQRVADQSIHAVEMEQELVQRLRRQIRWLCREINEVAFEFGRDYVCPPALTIDKGCQRSCVACWEEASLKAVAEEEDDA